MKIQLIIFSHARIIINRAGC